MENHKILKFTPIKLFDFQAQAALKDAAKQQETAKQKTEKVIC